MIFVLDNGLSGLEHQLAFVEPAGADETDALRKFEAVLRADPFRADAGIILVAPDMGARPEMVVRPRELFDGPGCWRIQLFDADTLSDEEIMSVLAFVAAWPRQRNLSPDVVEGVRREAARRGFARDALEAAS